MPTPDHQPSEDTPDGEVIARIHPALYTLACGGSGVLVAGLGYVPSLAAVVASFDIPLNFLLFLICGTICLGAQEKRSQTIPGLLLAVLALVASCLHLLLVNDHPWHP